ncbi:hypothetical protein BC826DRAFT_742731 [Russula brevipes]|nr:hypothetical protein BC826DRAFT_742731 [Russula brevipes]
MQPHGFDISLEYKVGPNPWRASPQLLFHIRSFQGTGLPSPFFTISTLLRSRPRSSFEFRSIIIIPTDILKMHSKQALAILALAACTATPVLSVPLANNQEQARAELDARFKFRPLLSNVAEDAAPSIFGSLFGGSNENNPRSAPSLDARAELDARRGRISVGGEGGGVLGDIAGSIVSNTISNELFGGSDDNRRDLTLDDLESEVAKAQVLGLAARDGTLNQVD